MSDHHVTAEIDWSFWLASSAHGRNEIHESAVLRATPYLRGAMRMSDKLETTKLIMTT